MSDQYAAYERVSLGAAVQPATGQPIEVIATKHRRNIPGFTDETCFAVERANALNGQVTEAWGFMSEADAWKFVTTRGKHGFQVANERGDLVEDVRECLGVPEGMTIRNAADVATGRDSAVTGSAGFSGRV